MVNGIELSESDLRFVVETVVTGRPDHDRVVELVRGKTDLVTPLLDNPKLFARLRNQKEAFARISPSLLFWVLLRQVRRELEETTYVYEVESRGRRLPLFQAPAVAALLSDRAVFDYLVQMLCSFVRTNIGVVYWRERGTWHRRKLSDLDSDDMIELARIVSPDLKLIYLQRVADLALFWSGIFPDSSASVQGRSRPAARQRRTLTDFENEGRRFYDLAAKVAEAAPLRHVLETLATEFAVARRALNTLSDRHLKVYRGHFFDGPSRACDGS